MLIWADGEVFSASKFGSLGEVQYDENAVSAGLAVDGSDAPSVYDNPGGSAAFLCEFTC